MNAPAKPQRKVIGRAMRWQICQAQTQTVQVGVRFALKDGGTAIGYFPLTKKALKGTVDALRRCGWKGTDIKLLEGLDAHEVELVLETEEYNGKKYERVRFVNALDLGNAMPAAKLDAFAAQVNGAIAELEGGAR